VRGSVRGGGAKNKTDGHKIKASVCPRGQNEKAEIATVMRPWRKRNRPKRGRAVRSREGGGIWGGQFKSMGKNDLGMG